jgi:hypothetical protein
MKQTKLKKITEYLHKNGHNLSGRVLTYPSGNEKIPSESYEIDRINIGADGIGGQYYIRVSFKGSLMWYEVPIAKGKEDEWWERVKLVIQELSTPIFEDFGESEDELNW